jgi:guanylate kinase
MSGKAIIFSAPSGSGKSTIIRYLTDSRLPIAFSVSATSRPPRGDERDGVEYYFLSVDDFRARIAAGDFLEYEEVYPGRYYGTLKAPVETLLAQGVNVMFDVDVVGGLNIKRYFGDRALAVFVRPPSVEALRARLTKRATDAPEVIEQRLAKADYELGFEPQFDVVVVNDDLAQAQAETLRIVREFLHPTPAL